MDLDDPMIVTGGGHLHAGGIVTVGRKKYAVGLYWQPSPSGRVSQAAREAARQPGQMADFYAVRAGNAAGRVPQFGLGQKEFGHKAGMPTGAASLAAEQPGSWAGVFKTVEGWWLVVSRDDLIAPDGDLLFDDEAEARQRLYEEMNLGGLQRVFAPDHWSVTGSDPAPLSLLMQGRTACRLQYVALPVKTIAIAGAVVLAVVVAGFFALTWQQERQNQFDQALQNLTPEQQAIARLQQQQQLAPPPPPPLPPKTWTKAPQPLQFLDACRQTMLVVPATVLGWKRGDVHCSGATLTVIWQRDKGPAIIPPNATVSSLQSSVSASYPLPTLQGRGDELLNPQGEIVRRILLGNWPITLDNLPDDQPIVPVAAPSALPGGLPGSGQNPAAVLPPPPWVKKKITLKGETAPWFIWGEYSGLPGVIIDSVKWSGQSWTTEGVIYENR